MLIKLIKKIREIVYIEKSIKKYSDNPNWKETILCVLVRWVRGSLINIKKNDEESRRCQL